MKKYHFPLAAMLMFALSFASCDKNNNGDEPTPNPTPSAPAAQLSSINTVENFTHNGISSTYTSNYLFEYNDLNKIKRIKETHEYEGKEYSDLSEFSWNPFSMSINGKKINVTLSPVGLVISAKVPNDSELTTFEYDSNGHLIRKIAVDTDYRSEINYTWKDNLLTEVDESWTEDKYSGKTLSVISYGTKPNKTGIWPAAFWLCNLIYFEPSNYECVCLLQTGLLGTAPTLLPNSITTEEISYNSGQTTQTKFTISNELDLWVRLSHETIEAYNNDESGSIEIKYTYCL